MNKLNVNILVQDNKFNNNEKKRENVLDVDFLSKSNKIREKKNFDVNDLLKVNRQKKEKLLETYIIQYNICIEKIKRLHKQNIHDLIFQVPPKVPDCSEYNSKNCIEFISSKLMGMHMDIYFMNDTTFFVTWKYIESNTKKQSV